MTTTAHIGIQLCCRCDPKTARGRSEGRHRGYPRPPAYRLGNQAVDLQDIQGQELCTSIPRLGPPPRIVRRLVSTLCLVVQWVELQNRNRETKVVVLFV